MAHSDALLARLIATGRYVRFIRRGGRNTAILRAASHPCFGVVLSADRTDFARDDWARTQHIARDEEEEVSVVKTKATPSREELVQIIESAGSSEESYFGFPERPGGLYLQQDPEEFAAFVHFMATKVPPAQLTLDIGIASGGQTKFLRDYYPSEKTIVVDNGKHSRFPHWERIKKDLNSELVLEIIDDSHAPAVRQKLLPFAGGVDFAYVDGDHSYRGLRKDIFLVKELLRLGGLMALHDTLAVEDCRKVHEEMLASRSFALLRNYQNRFGISVWKLVSRKKMPTNINRTYGIGRL